MNIATISSLFFSDWKLIQRNKMLWMYWLFSFIVPCIAIFFRSVAEGLERGYIPNLQASITARNFIFAPMILVSLTLYLFSDFYKNGMLKEVFSFAVSRSQYFFSKILLLLAISGISLILSALPSFIWFAATPEMVVHHPIPTIQGYLFAWCGDLLLIAISIVIALYTKKSANHLAYILLCMFSDWCLWLLIQIARFIIGDNVFFQKIAPVVLEYMPSAVWISWSVWEESWTPLSFLLLVLYTIGLLYLAHTKWTKLEF